MNAHLTTFQDRSTLTRTLAETISHRLAGDITTRGQASLAVSGGSTPRPLFERLSNMDLAWHRVTVTLVDERMVAPDHPDSNEGLVRNHLLKNQAARARFIGMMPADRPEDSEHHCQHGQQHILRPLTLVILGMGNDGHTASLFPGAPELAEATRPDQQRLCMALTPPRAPHRRLSMTVNGILDSGRILVHITGQDKWRALEQAREDGPARDMPIRFILRQQRTPVQVFWAP